MAQNANLMTSLQPLLFSAAQVVSGEPVGCLDGINKQFDDKGVAVGDKVLVPVSPTRAVEDFVPAPYAPAGLDSTAGNVEVTITGNKMASWHLTGEQIRSLDNADSNKEWVRQMVLQGMRALRNAADADCGVAIKQGACRALGTVGVTPFADGMQAWTDVWAEAKKNGAPFSDMQFAMSIPAYQNLLKLGTVQQAYAAGGDEERRTGFIKSQFGFMPRPDAFLAAHTPGGGTSYVINSAGGVTVGDYTLTAKTGNGTMLAGDVLSIQSDTANKYVCNTGLAAPGAFIIGRPGLRVETSDSKTITIGASYMPNLAFERSSVVGIMRPPLVPQNPTITQMPISDAFGLTYLLLDIAQYGQRTWELHLAWGFKAVQPEHIFILMG